MLWWPQKLGASTISRGLSKFTTSDMPRSSDWCENFKPLILGFRMCFIPGTQNDMEHGWLHTSTRLCPRSTCASASSFDGTTSTKIPINSSTTLFYTENCEQNEQMNLSTTREMRSKQPQTLFPFLVFLISFGRFSSCFFFLIIFIFKCDKTRTSKHSRDSSYCTCRSSNGVPLITVNTNNLSTSNTSWVSSPINHQSLCCFCMFLPADRKPRTRNAHFWWLGGVGRGGARCDRHVNICTCLMLRYWDLL